MAIILDIGRKFAYVSLYWVEYEHWNKVCLCTYAYMGPAMFINELYIVYCKPGEDYGLILGVSGESICGHGEAARVLESRGLGL